MQLISFMFVILAVAAIVYAVPKPDENTYTNKYDNIDIDKILENDRLLKNYIACVEGTGKCTPDGEELKKHSKEAMDNCCENCTSKQKEMIKKVWKHLKTNQPDTFNALVKKFDPTGERQEKCKSQIEEIA